MDMFAETAPLLSPRTAFVCAVLYTLFYVAPFYLSPTLRSTPLRSRDATPVIRARVRAVGLTCLACTLVTVYLLSVYGHATPRDILRLLAIWPWQLLDVLKVGLLVAVLFSGPLYESIVVDGNWRDWSPSAVKAGMFDSWIGYRNLLVAPVSEELVFRSLIISLYLLARVPPARIVFTTPLVFGLAHLHHLAEFLQSRTPPGRRLPPLAACVQGGVRSLFQFTYTALFGFFAAFVWLRTGSLPAAVVAHMFCNWQGVPRLAGRVGRSAAWDPPAPSVTPDVAQGKRGRDGSTPRPGEDEVPRAAPTDISLAWTVLYYALLVAGSVAFYKLLWPLTESSNALARFG